MTVTRQPSLDRSDLGSTGQRNNFIEYVCWETRSERRTRAKSLISVRKTPGSRSWWRRRCSKTVCWA